MRKNTLSLAYVVALTFLAVTPEKTHAGAGYEFKLTNDMTPYKGDNTYPRVALHEYGGWSCWYPNSLEDWNQYAIPGDRERSLYTEARDSLGCFFETSNIQFAVFIKPNENSQWVRVGNAAKLWNNLNADQGFYINPPLPWNNVPFVDMCGLKFSSGLGGYAPFTNVNYVKVSGSPKLENCAEAFPNTGIALTSSNEGTAMTARANLMDGPEQASDESLYDRNVKTIKLKVGQSKTIILPTIDKDSTWELDGGDCQGGDGVFESDLKKSYTKNRVLPASVKVTAKGVGQGTCYITAYHNPERTILQKGKVIFTAK